MANQQLLRPSHSSLHSSKHSASLRYPCSPVLLSSKRRSSVEPIPPLIHHPKEPHAVVATQSHPQHGLLQAHPLVAVSAGHAPHLFLCGVPGRHVRRNHARHAPVHHQIQFRRPGLHPRRRRGGPPHRSRPFRRPSQVLQLRRIQIALRQARRPPPAPHSRHQGRYRRQKSERPYHHREHRPRILLAHQLGGNRSPPSLVSHHRRHAFPRYQAGHRQSPRAYRRSFPAPLQVARLRISRRLLERIRGHRRRGPFAQFYRPGHARRNPASQSVLFSRSHRTEPSRLRGVQHPGLRAFHHHRVGRSP